jgi:hypothetical protein
MTPPTHALFQQPWPEGEHRFFQLGFLVEDIVEAAATWARVFGVGPFHVLPIVDQVGTLHGEPATTTIQVAAAQAGPVQIELIQQHCDRPSIFHQWHRGRVAGFHQICSVVRDYDATKARYAGLGYELAAESVNGSFRVAYVDTAADFGFYTEIVEETPRFLAQVANLAQTCAEWDGTTDPVRLLTRGGYRVPGSDELIATT